MLAQLAVFEEQRKHGTVKVVLVEALIRDVAAAAVDDAEGAAEVPERPPRDSEESRVESSVA